MHSIWQETAQPPRFPALPGGAQTEVLVIGGGMAGVLTARELHDRGVDCLLIESGRIGGGTTGGTTAVLSAQHDALYQDLIRRFGEQKAGLVLRANLEAVQRFRDLGRRWDCDFADAPSYMYSRTDPSPLRREVEALHRLGYEEARFTTDTELPFPVQGAVVYPGMAQFHPLKFLAAAAQGLAIYEDTQALAIERGVVRTTRGDIRCREVVVATHFPILNRRGQYFMKLYQMRSYVLALENAPALRGTYVDHAPGGLYLRSWQGLTLAGGGDHRTGKAGGGYAAVERLVRQAYPQARIAARWAAQDCMSLDGVPYIGPYSPSAPHLNVATGFDEWGMTSSMAAAHLLADRITGWNNPFAPAFAPRRTLLRPQLAANLLDTALGLLGPTARRCPHLGCALHWNAAEHSWDCACHGSRFDEDGALLDNPAQRGLR